MDNTQLNKPQFYDIVVIDLPLDLKETYYYQLINHSTHLEPGVFDNFPTMVLSLVQDPILNIALFYDELVTHHECGDLTILKEQINNPEITEHELFKLIGHQLLSLVDYIHELFSTHPEELQLYNHAEFVDRGIMLICVKDIEEMDRVRLR